MVLLTGLAGWMGACQLGADAPEPTPGAPTATRVLPSATSGYTSQVVIELTGLPTLGGTLKIFATSDCSGGAVSASAISGRSLVDVHVTASDTGLNTFSASVTGGSGGDTPCSNSVTYTLIAPPTPSSMTLSDPVASPSADTTPTYTVAGLADGLNLAIYKDAACTEQVGALPQVSGTSASVTLGALTTLGAYTFYAQLDNGDVYGNCSALLASYTLIAATTPTSLSLVNPAASPGYTRTPTISFSGASPGSVIQLYESGCNSSVFGTGQADGSGNGSITVPSTTPLSVAAHTLYTKAVSEAGSSACSGTTLAYTVSAFPTPTAMALVTPAA
ncbi:MAG TPA: hypothetical protein VL588_06975, partial [Bdellovibrionota bacterium]|nr:hypothetical protein [Bdellovibrionota bacterium]